MMAENTILKETVDGPFRKLEEIYSRLSDIKRVIDRMQVVFMEETHNPGYDKVDALHYMIGDTHSDLGLYLYPEGNTAVRK
jgi:hypothetical protein